MGCAFYEAQALEILKTKKKGGYNVVLKIDLQRLGPLPGDSTYLLSLLRAAKSNLGRQGVEESGDEDYLQLVVGTAAWMYRKRINGESEPIYLKRMRHDLLISQKMRGEENAP